MSFVLPGHDLRLARRAAAGEPDAWREIVDRFGPRIHSLALHFSRDPERAQDLTQDIFLRLSRNLCIDDYRRRRLERSFRFLPLDTIETLRSTSDPAREAQQRELLAELEATLAELDPETALILTLRDLEGLSYRELEALLDLPSGTVKSRIHRGRRELLRRLELRRATAPAPAGGQRSAFLKVAPC